MKVLGIDIGGSHISACMVDLDDASFLKAAEVHAKIDPSGSAPELITAWSNVIRQCFDKAGEPLGYIGIAMPGPFDYNSGISLITGLHKFESLYGLNVKEMLAAELSIKPGNIRFINDASAFLLGELKTGAGKGFSNAAGVTLGTGLGSAGYFHNELHDGDLWCTPFKDSRAEDYLCSRWVVQEYRNLSGRTIQGVKDLAPLYNDDEHAKAVFEKFGQHLGEVLLMKYPPSVQDVVVIGGNIAKAWGCFIPAVQKYFSQNNVQMNLRAASLGEDAAIMGAACLWV